MQTLSENDYFLFPSLPPAASERAKPKPKKAYKKIIIRKTHYRRKLCVVCSSYRRSRSERERSSYKSTHDEPLRRLFIVVIFLRYCFLRFRLWVKRCSNGAPSAVNWIQQPNQRVLSRDTRRFCLQIIHFSSSFYPLIAIYLFLSFFFLLRLSSAELGGGRNTLSRACRRRVGIALKLRGPEGSCMHILSMAD